MLPMLNAERGTIVWGLTYNKSGKVMSCEVDSMKPCSLACPLCGKDSLVSSRMLSTPLSILRNTPGCLQIPQDHLAGSTNRSLSSEVTRRYLLRSRASAGLCCACATRCRTPLAERRPLTHRVVPLRNRPARFGSC